MSSDNPSHIDRPVTPHADVPGPPHIDIKPGPHVDVPGVPSGTGESQGDTKESGTAGQHVDIPGRHIDQQTQGVHADVATPFVDVNK